MTGPRRDAFDEGQAKFSYQDAEILRFAGRQYRHEGAKQQDIRRQFGMSGTQYYQRLNALMDHPAAVRFNGGEFAPTVSRLQRIRQEKRDKRSRP